MYPPLEETLWAARGHPLAQHCPCSWWLIQRLGGRSYPTSRPIQHIEHELSFPSQRLMHKPHLPLLFYNSSHCTDTSQWLIMVDGWPIWALATKGLEALVTNRFLKSDLPQTALARGKKPSCFHFLFCKEHHNLHLSGWDDIQYPPTFCFDRIDCKVCLSFYSRFYLFVSPNVIDH